jgi:hypothetical protein
MQTTEGMILRVINKVAMLVYGIGTGKLLSSQQSRRFIRSQEASRWRMRGAHLVCQASSFAISRPIELHDGELYKV